VATAILARLQRLDPASGAFASEAVEAAFQKILEAVRSIPYATSRVSFKDGVQTVVEPAIATHVQGNRIQVRQTTHRIAWACCARRSCRRCGLQTPLPDSAGAEYILRRNKVNAVHPVSPERADAAARSDVSWGVYPVRGWTGIDDLGAMLCPDCSGELKALTADFIKAPPAAP